MALPKFTGRTEIVQAVPLIAAWELKPDWARRMQHLWDDSGQYIHDQWICFEYDSDADAYRDGVVE